MRRGGCRRAARRRSCLVLTFALSAAGCDAPARPTPPAVRRYIPPIHSGPPGPAGPPAPATLPPPRDLREPPALADVLPSGLVTRVLRSGRGRRPGPRDKVRVHYTGWTEDGEMFDSTQVAGGKPVAFRVDAAIPGWSEALVLMHEGERRRLWIPPRLAFAGQPDKPQGRVVFDVELLRVKPAAPVVRGDPRPPGDPLPVAAALREARRRGEPRHCLRSQGFVRDGRAVSHEQAIELCYRELAAARKDMHLCSFLGDDDVRLACTNDVMRARGVDEKLRRM